MSLLVCGVGLLYLFFETAAVTFVTLGSAGPVGLVWLAAAAAVAAALPRRFTSTPLNRVGSIIAARPISSAVIAAVASAAYLYATAVGQGRSFHPAVHDEFSYLVQAHQFARGHGWYAAHPLGPFFDSFQLLVAPVYASAYFPGTALLYVPGVWLGLPPWVTSLAVAAAVAGLLFRAVAMALDGPSAIAAVLLLWVDGQYRTASVAVLGQMPTLALGLAATVAALAFLRDGRLRWAVVAGACLGWAAVTRPLDAACFGLPIAIALVARRPRVVTVAGLLLPALPFLAAQVTLNHGITGHWLTTPFRLYADRDYPGTHYGFNAYDPSAAPASPLPQKRALYDEYRPLLREHTVGHIVDDQFRNHGPMMPPRLPVTLTQLTVVPFALLVVVMPVALAGATRPRLLLLAPLPLFVVVYAGYVFFFPHYVLVVSAAVIAAVLVAGRALVQLAPPSVLPRASVAAFVVLTAVAVAGLPQLDGSGQPYTDDPFATPLLDDVDRQLAKLAGRGRAVVLFTFDPKRSAHEEPVYNAAVGWPDDAAVVRAHDLGPGRDRELFRYYADRQPDRLAYRYDEATRTLTPLGAVGAIAGR